MLLNILSAQPRSLVPAKKSSSDLYSLESESAEWLSNEEQVVSGCVNLEVELISVVLLGCEVYFICLSSLRNILARVVLKRRLEFGNACDGIAETES